MYRFDKTATQIKFGKSYSALNLETKMEVVDFIRAIQPYSR